MEDIITDKKLPPGPKGFSELARWGKEIQKDPLPTYERMHREFGDLAYCPWPGKICLFVWHPKDIGHVLKDNHTNYHKTEQYEEMRPLLGQGLLTSNGELWRHQRKLMAKQFHASSIDSYATPIKLLIDRSLGHLTPGQVDIENFFKALTMEIAGEIFFGSKVDNFISTIGAGLEYESEIVNRRIRNPFNIPLYIPTPENIKRKFTIARMNKVVNKIMDEDQRNKPENVLSKLVKDGEISRKQIRDEVMTLLLAGHETTSNNLMWTTWFLARYPQCQTAILDELNGLNKKASDLVRTDLPSLKVLRSVLLESLRLMPPAPVIARNNIEDDVIGGFHVPKDTSIVCQQWVTHRDERFWPDPTAYKPERFIDRPDKRDDYSFFPFARGPRACIGEEMAMVEACLILASMVERYSWKLKDGFEPIPVHHLTLQSRNGMWLELRSRN